MFFVMYRLIALVKEILSLFTVGALSGASFDLSSDCLGQEILTLFAGGCALCCFF